MLLTALDCATSIPRHSALPISIFRRQSPDRRRREFQQLRPDLHRHRRPAHAPAPAPTPVQPCTRRVLEAPPLGTWRISQNCILFNVKPPVASSPIAHRHRIRCHHALGSIINCLSPASLRFQRARAILFPRAPCTLPLACDRVQGRFFRLRRGCHHGSTVSNIETAPAPRVTVVIFSSIQSLLQPAAAFSGSLFSVQS